METASRPSRRIPILSQYNTPKSLPITLGNWLSKVDLHVNVRNCSTLVFFLWPSCSASAPYWTSRISQVSRVKYWCVISHDNLICTFYTLCTASRCSKATGHLSNHDLWRFNPRRTKLVHLEKRYLCSIVEFGCVLFSIITAYRLHLLFLHLLERWALRLSLVLPQNIYNEALYTGAPIQPLQTWFRLLDFQRWVQFKLMCTHFCELKHFRSSEYISSISRH